MDSSSLILIPPTPVQRLEPSPVSTAASSLPELTPSIDPERTSSETTIVTIYSMYEEEEESGSWSASQPHLDRRHRSQKHTAATLSPYPDYHDSYLQQDGRRQEDSGYYEYDVMQQDRRLSTKVDTRISVVSDDSTQLPYNRPHSNYQRVNSGTRTNSEHFSEGARKSHAFPDSNARSSQSRSRPPSQAPSAPLSRPTSTHRKSTTSPRTSENGNSPYTTPPESFPSASATSSPAGTAPSPPPPTQSPPLLTIPSTPHITPQKRTPKTSTPDSKHSQLSFVPSEGEDPDAFHVRSTYAQLDLCGVKGDGIEEGVERTRARVGGSRASELRAAEALADETEKTRELTPKEIQVLSSLDRYGFFVTPSHERLIMLPAAPLHKPLSHITSTSTNASANPPLLRSQPAAPPPIKEIERTAKWGRMVEARSRDEGGNVESWGVKSSKERKLSGRTFKGIPDCWRSAGWEILMNRYTKSGKQELKKLAEVYRQKLDMPSSYDVQIDLDVPRTISGHVMFRTRYGQGQRSLFHVLHCLSLHCETCGYCQGMGPIAATLLCYFEPERVYASLVRIHDAYSMHSIFSPGFPGLLEAIYVQERIMEQMMPSVYEAFKKHMISTTSYATKWYITLFANSVPFQTQLRLWDAFLLEGHDVFVIVAVAIVWVYRDHITSQAANFESVLSLLSSFFVPEDENALLTWIEKAAMDQKLRASMQQWRADWRRLVAEGKQGTALL